MAIFDEEELDLGPSQKKIYRGGYDYSHNGNVYTEETFEVYRDKKELTLTFLSELHTRVSTGELLKISINYQVGKDFVPLKVTVKKDLGKEMTEEQYRFDSKKNNLQYTFKNKRSREKREMSTSPRFSIMTPSACTSMLFILTKKFDSTSKNFYSIINSYNEWEFEKELETKTLVLEKISLTSETINIGGHDVQAVQYKVYEDQKDGGDKNQHYDPPSIKTFISKYHSIPYTITTPDGRLIQVKYFNDLEGAS